MTFREAAPQWCWLAARALNWRPQEFWEATPAELTNALRDPAEANGQGAPSRELIEMMMERDPDGR